MWRKINKRGDINVAAVSLMAAFLVSPALAQDPVPANQPKVTTQTEVIAGKSVSPMLTADSAEKMNSAIERYRNIVADGGFPKVSKGSYKKGSEGKPVEALNRRLFMDGYLRPEAVSGEFAGRVTSATIDAVTRFQRNLGLGATGKVDAATVAALNVPAEERLQTMQANVARLAAYSANLGNRYLVVNIPAQQIETVNNGRVFSRHNAIVGRKERPTPVVITALSDINFNPYWNAPVSIVERDLIPKILSGTQVLTDMNMKVFKGFGGPEVDPKQVDWRTAIADDYHFRQEPGPANAMATAKINFPSPFGIYLHDTPEKQLFKNSNRFYSSGCVRVEKVELLLEWVLNGQDDIGKSQIAALAETLERRDVKLTAPPQLRVAYLTAWPVGNRGIP
jgi:L,D-transpeptidase YcbB